MITRSAFICACVGCPSSTLQLITDAQVIQSDIVSGSGFSDIISVSSFVTYYWSGALSQLPNNGTWTFDMPYVIIGLTSVGYYNLISYYVTSFSLSYSNSLNGSFQNLSQVRYSLNIVTTTYNIVLQYQYTKWSRFFL